MAKVFRGCYPALVTPMLAGDGLSNPVNLAAMNKLIDYVVRGGVHGIVVGGCTGHASSMSWDEQVSLIKNSLEHVSSRVDFVAGDGSNSTREAINAAKRVEDLGVMTHLQISPYQNKPMQEGLYQHYARIASAIDGKIIIYNVPGRTGRNIDASTTVRLAREFSNIVAVKEASGNMEQIRRIIDETSDMDFSVVSGDDKLSLDIIKAGGVGSISVAANVDPRRTSDVVRMALDRRFDEAKAVDDRLQGLYSALFVETNPSPCHYALSRLGIQVGVPRLPLIDVSDETKALIDRTLIGLELL